VKKSVTLWESTLVGKTSKEQFIMFKNQQTGQYDYNRITEEDISKKEEASHQITTEEEQLTEF
jgi:glycine cleavage system aminomethyltransferase T